VWQRFADHYYLFRGTPTGAWLEYELHEVFGIGERLSGETAPRIYDEITEKLAAPDFRPRALFERFAIELLATTDKASDPLQHHQAIRDSGWQGRVIPCFRPMPCSRSPPRLAGRAGSAGPGARRAPGELR